MIRFNSDYTEGCHTAILEKLVETNMEQTAGYGEDEYCGQARELIRKACGDERVDVHFLVGGTQTNVTVISVALKHYQGVITAKTGHINVHETGALEACGHKCLCIETPDGKLTAEQIAAYTDAHLQTRVLNIWYSRKWYTFPIRQRSERFIKRRNWKQFIRCAKSVGSIFSWMGRDLAMD